MTDRELIKPKAYSYLRFSNWEQRSGDSYRRQATMAIDYALRHGLELDRVLTYEDLGVSAWRSLNSRTGRLSEFQDAVNSGQVLPGSYLLVESLDRISRDRVLFAIDLLNRIILAGVIIVTLTDGQVYSIDRLRADPMTLMYALISFMRANEESEMRSKRLRHAWAAKRANAPERLYTRRCPAWLRFDDQSHSFEVIPERAALIVRIYSYAASTKGKTSIAKILNEEGVRPWGRSDYWCRASIWKILNNPAVLGTMTPHVLVHVDGHIRREAQDPIENAWPAVITKELFEEVRAKYATVATTRKGVSFNTMMMNTLSRLAVCSECGEGMYRHGIKPRNRLPIMFSCRRVLEAVGCGTRNLFYADIERAILTKLPCELERLGEGLNDDPMQDRIVEAERELAKLTDILNFLTDTILLERSRTLLERIHTLECAAEVLRTRIEGLRRTYSNRSGPLAQARIRHALAQFPRHEGDLPDRAALNKALRRVFVKCVVNKREATADFRTAEGDSVKLFFGSTVAG